MITIKLLNDKYRCLSGRFPLFVNEGLSLTIVNETTKFLKTVVFENDRFLKRFLLKNDRFKKGSFRLSFFRRRFHNKTIVFKKNENDPSLGVGTIVNRTCLTF